MSRIDNSKKKRAYLTVKLLYLFIILSVYSIEFFLLSNKPQINFKLFFFASKLDSPFIPIFA